MIKFSKIELELLLYKLMHLFVILCIQGDENNFLFWWNNLMIE